DLLFLWDEWRGWAGVQLKNWQGMGKRGDVTIALFQEWGKEVPVLLPALDGVRAIYQESGNRA
ncbi:MAG TPA: hypothetical protein VF126_07105, partial [Acidobacteriaceae bacterium]